MIFSAAIATLLLSASCQLAGSQTIDPKSVDDKTKAKWCIDQKSTCPLLCLQIPGITSRPQQNDCTPETLSYICVCSNGQQPNASEYSLTIPYHECQEYGNQCVRACPSNDAGCQTACRTNNPCGAQDPIRVNVSITSTVATSTATATALTTGDATETSAEVTAVYTGFSSEPTPSAESGSDNTNNAQALVIGFGHTYGLVIVLTFICGCFTFMV